MVTLGDTWGRLSPCGSWTILEAWEWLYLDGVGNVAHVHKEIVTMATYNNETPATGIAGTVLGSIGTALGLGLFNNNGGWFGRNGNCAGYGYGDQAMILDIAAKDATIGQLRSEQSTDKKLVEVYNALFKNDKEQNAKMDAMHTNLAILNTQVAQLMGLTALHIPATNVCPLPMPRYNQWSVDPLASAVAPAAAEPTANA